jgi:hypothetical protein
MTNFQLYSLTVLFAALVAPYVALLSFLVF